MARDLKARKKAILRAYTVHSLHEDGMTYQEIGEQMGVTASRAHSLGQQGQRLIDTRFRSLNECAVIITQRQKS